MADDTVTHEEDALLERDDFDNGEDPFAALMDLVPHNGDDSAPADNATRPEAMAAPAAPKVEPPAALPVEEPKDEVPVIAVSDHPEVEIAAEDAEMSDALMAAFTNEDTDNVVDENVPYDAPAIARDVTLPPPMDEAEEDALDSFLMAEFDEPQPEITSEVLAQEDVTIGEPDSIELNFDDDITLDDLGIDDFALGAPVAAPVAEPDDIEDALFAELTLDEPAVAAIEPTVAEIDIDDFLGDALDDIGDDVLPESEELVEAAPKAPSISQATIAATTLGGGSKGWLDNRPINIDSDIGNASDDAFDTSGDASSVAQPADDDILELDLASDFELDLEGEINDFDLDLSDTDLEAAIDVAPDEEPGPELEFADDDAVLDAQIKSLEESYDRPAAAPIAGQEERTPPVDEDFAVKTATMGAAVAGTVGLGLSTVFGGRKTATEDSQTAAPESERAQMSINDLDDVLDEMDAVHADEPHIALDAAADDMAIDLALDDLDLLPEINTIEFGGVPVTESISVPHVDYDMHSNAQTSGDDFEQAISDSFSEMQDGDLISRADIVEDIDLDIDLSGLDFQQEGASDLAYDQLLAEEGVQAEALFDQQSSERELNAPETEDLALGDIRFDEDDIAGLREQSGTSALDAETRAMPLSEMTGMAAAHRVAKKPNKRKGLIVVACLGIVALAAGAVGIGSQFFGSDMTTDTAMVIPADTADVKMVPSEQSGLQVPNQERAVFNESATTTSNTGEQGSLVDGREPLVDGVKDTDRITPADTAQSEAAKALEDAAQSVMTPRRVQTLVVKPDGTLAPASEATIAPVANEPAAVDAERLLPSTSDEGVGADIASAPQQVVRTVTVREGETPQIAANPTPRAVQPQAPPEVAPLVPSRPANQPVNIVNQDNNTQVAAVAPERPAIAAGTYFVQIASQPSEADARASGNTLTRRYANVVGGRGFVIQRAVIDGKGTFFRVRVPAGTRAEANTLCSRYKSAGGSCFISR